MSQSICTSVEKSIDTNVNKDIMIQKWLVIYVSSLTDDLQRVHLNRISGIFACWFETALLLNSVVQGFGVNIV